MPFTHMVFSPTYSYMGIPKHSNPHSPPGQVNSLSYHCNIIAVKYFHDVFKDLNLTLEAAHYAFWSKFIRAGVTTAGLWLNLVKTVPPLIGVSTDGNGQRIFVGQIQG